MIPEADPSRGASRILLVDDSDIVRDLTAAILRPAGYVIAVATNGAEAVEAVRHERYDMVLMDLNMPVMDGFAASRAIRALGVDPDRLPLVALTVRPEAEEVEERRDAGINGSLAKPFSAQDLLVLVRHWIAHAAIAASATTIEVWDRETYRELTCGLGAERTSDLLLMFEQQLTRALLVPGIAPYDPEHMAREAHNLVSCAGMLGFRELAQASRAIMAMPEADAWDAALDAFRRAAERVLASLRRHPRSV